MQTFRALWQAKFVQIKNYYAQRFKLQTFITKNLKKKI